MTYNKRKENGQLLASAAAFISWVANDYILDPESEDYTGFVNIALDDIRDEQNQENFKSFIKLYSHEPILADRLLRNVGLDLESYPSLQETIFLVKE